MVSCCTNSDGIGTYSDDDDILDRHSRKMVVRAGVLSGCKIGLCLRCTVNNGFAGCHVRNLYMYDEDVISSNCDTGTKAPHLLVFRTVSLYLALQYCRFTNPTCLQKRGCDTSITCVGLTSYNVRSKSVGHVSTMRTSTSSIANPESCHASSPSMAS
jgi:hypothetical protein